VPPELRAVEGRGILELAVAPARGTSGVGAVIVDPASSDLIPGVEIEAGMLWPDDRGYFSELFRLSDAGGAGFTRGFGASIQVSAALSHAGTIKAFHYHCLQTDLWAPLRGNLQVGLYDLRVGSPSFGRTNTLYIGEWRPWRLRIPPGVAHGYKVIGDAEVLLVYATDRFYDPADEGRLPYNDTGIAYDWETQHK
jgi:dTDP-4-dehydrorhamnose 3,5-epimerase